MKKLVAITALATGLILATPVFAAEPAAPAKAQGLTKEQVQIALEKIRSDKKFIVSQNLPLTDAESKAFWPIYEEYQEGLLKLNQRTSTLLGDYADLYRTNTVTDAAASKLLDQYLTLETDELALKKSFIPKLTKVLPPIKAVRYMQIENKMRAIVKAKIAEIVPLVK